MTSLPLIKCGASFSGGSSSIQNYIYTKNRSQEMFWFYKYFMFTFETIIWIISSTLKRFIFHSQETCLSHKFMKSIFYPSLSTRQ